MAPRAKIFRRDAKVTDMESLKRIMRSNGWPLDDYSGGSPFGASAPPRASTLLE